MNIKVIVNPRAGDGKARETGFEVEKFLHSKGISYSLDSTYRPLGATSLAKKAVSDGFDLVIAVGGDGTVNEVLNGIVGSNATLAVIPAGNENNFSLSIGLNPGNIREACETALSSGTRKVDVGKVNDKYFINSIGFGLKADIAKSGGKIPFLKGKFAFVAKLLKALFKYKSPKLSIKIGDVDLISNVLMTKVSNGKFFGSGLTLAPSASITDGLFDIAVYNDTGKIKFLADLPKLAAGTHNKSYPVQLFRHDSVVIDSQFPLNATCDGELIDGHSSYRITMAQDKIPVKSK